ncbi:MAG: CHASE3 domain-containing protein [Chitinophagaceae bacterium]
MLTSSTDKIENKVHWGYIIAFILLLLSYILNFYSSQQVLNQQERVSHTTDITNALDDLIFEIRDAESAFSGYLVIKDEVFLKRYHIAPNLVSSTVLHLKSLTQDNPIQQNRLDSLQKLIKNKLDILSTGLLQFKANNYIVSDSMRKMAYTGNQVMENIKDLVNRMQTEENIFITTRTNLTNNFSNFIKVINIASFVIAIVLAIYSIVTFNKANKARQMADKQSEQYKNQLQLRVDELDKLNKELIELRSIEKFAATGRISRTIAHEVRNPLTNINLATEHLRSEVKSESETDILFDMISRNSNRINELINDLLNSTKAAQLNFTKVNINDIVDQSIGFAQDRIDLKGIRVIKNYASALCPVLVDIEKINIAFLNIIINAVEAIDSKNGILNITTENKNKRCVVTISDNGKGMSKDSLSKLFEPYFTTKETGTGLGLTNTQNIILSHHANIYAESKEGEGASFIISFNYA